MDRATNAQPREDAAARLRAANRKTAAILALIALVFFGGIFASQSFGGVAVGMSVIAVGIVLYLIVAIGHGLLSRK